MKPLLLLGLNPELWGPALIIGAAVAVVYIAANDRGRQVRVQCPPSPRRESRPSSNASRDQDPLRDRARQALNAIGYPLDDNIPTNLARRGQHVINNGVLSFHRGVLADLLEELGPSSGDTLEMLLSDVATSLDRRDRRAIERMVVHFRPDEPYVDYNAQVFGAYNRELRKAIVAYLKAVTSVWHGENRNVWQLGFRVRELVDLMNRYEVYVDPMARDRWISENGSDGYEDCRMRVARMFEDILQDFHKVINKIKFFRRRNNWNWP